MKRPVVSPAFLPLLPPPNSYTLQEERFYSPLTFQNSWSVSNKRDTQKRKFRSDQAAEETQMTSGHLLPSIGETQPFLNAKVEAFPHSSSGKSLFCGMYIANTSHHCSNPAFCFIWGMQGQPSHWCLDHYTTDNCCKPYTQEAMILGRNFRIVSNKQCFLTSLEMWHLLSYLNGVRFPLSKGKQEFQIRTKADAFQTRLIKNAFMSSVVLSGERPTILHSQERLLELIERVILVAGYLHHCSTLAIVQNKSYEKCQGKQRNIVFIKGCRW